MSKINTIIENIVNNYLNQAANYDLMLGDWSYLVESADLILNTSDDPYSTYEDFLYILQHVRLNQFQDARGTERDLIDNMLSEVLDAVDDLYYDLYSDPH